MVKAYCEVFQKLWIAQEFNVSRSSNETIEVFLLNVKDYINPTDLIGLHLAEQIVDHFTYYFFFYLVS